MGTRLVAGTNDLATLRPDLALQWDKTRNENLSPNDVLPGSNKKVWWICNFGHGWDAAPATRSRGIGCPICSNQRVLAGYNDLATTHPILVKEWHHSKNAGTAPSDIVAGTNKKFWWQCVKGHEWEAAANRRAYQKTGCPFCSNQFVLVGFNDLATVRPKLAAEWHHEKNSPKSASEVVAGSNKKYWWCCSLGHEWEQSPNARSKSGGCPVCSHQMLWPGFNDLQTIKPRLAAQWDSEKNGVSASQIMTGAKFFAWWKCDQGHEWQSPLRGRKDGNCPICLNRVLEIGFNDLQTKSAALAKQWNKTKNGDLTPDQVPFSSRSAKYWWDCENGHTWQASLASRKIGNGCPVCSGQLLVPGLNDMATTHPEIAASFNMDKNKPTTPEQIFAGAGKSFWWICELGHEWKTSANSRYNGAGCPTCAEYGFKPHKPAIFYFIMNESLSARKVGVTNSEDRRIRLSGFEKRGWTEILIVESTSGEKILELEKLILKWIRHDLRMPIFLTAKEMGRQGGWTETFAAEGISNEEISYKIATMKDSLGIK
jgi:hypothetical protein